MRAPQENQLGLLAPLKTRAPPRLHSPHLPGGRSTIQACAQVLAYLALSGRAASTLTGTSRPWPWDLLSPLSGALPCWVHSGPQAPQSAHRPDLGVSSGRHQHACQVRERCAQVPRPRPPSPLPRASSQQQPRREHEAAAPDPAGLRTTLRRKPRTLAGTPVSWARRPPNQPTPAPALSRPLADILSSDH